MKFDMHCHTKEGSPDGRIPIKEYILELKKQGFDGMLVSDHNSYNGYRYWKKHREEMPEFIVLKGIEYDTIDAGHILVILPTGVKVPLMELRGLPVNLLIDIVHRHGGILGPAHPCGERFLSLTNNRKFRKQKSLMERFDFVEAFNSCESEESNRGAQLLAAAYDKPGLGGSDSHRPDCVGTAWTCFEGNIRCETDLINHILSREAVPEVFITTALPRTSSASSIICWYSPSGSTTRAAVSCADTNAHSHFALTMPAHSICIMKNAGAHTDPAFLMRRGAGRKKLFAQPAPRAGHAYFLLCSLAASFSSSSPSRNLAEIIPGLSSNSLRRK